MPDDDGLMPDAKKSSQDFLNHSMWKPNVHCPQDENQQYSPTATGHKKRNSKAQQEEHEVEGLPM
jgi:hypothetical protein